MKRFLLAFSGVLLSVFCCIFLSTQSTNAAGSVSGSPTVARGVYVNGGPLLFTSTFRTNESVGIFGPTGSYSPFINGVGYVLAFNALNGASKFSGHATIPVITSSFTGNYTKYDRDTCGLDTIRIGVGGEFWLNNLTNVSITNCTSSYRSNYNAVSGQRIVAKIIDFDFSGELSSPVSGATNLSIQYYSSNPSNLIYQWVSSDPSFYFNYDSVRPHFTLSFGNDLSSVLLQQQINQNQTIINQNQQLIDSSNAQTDAINDLESSITDSSVEGDFSVSAIQPFGPIGAITNAILALPQTLLTLGDCSDITLNLPFVDEPITLPCMSPILDSMGGALVTSIDVILSASIWFVVAKYIFRKVQELRDPKNDDEEYLDL